MSCISEIKNKSFTNLFTVQKLRGENYIKKPPSAKFREILLSR